MSPDSIISFVQVRKVLDRSPSQHASLFISLTKNGNNHAHACKPAARVPFGPNASDFPGLGKKISPFHASKLPSIEGLQRLLIDDLQTARRTQGHGNSSVLESTGEAEADERDEEMEVLNSLTNGDRTTRGAVAGFLSPSLDDICGDVKVEYENVLRESMTTATVLPAETLIPVQHSNEGTTFTALLAGSVAWIIWPPTKDNLDILQDAYDAFSEGFDGTKMDVSSRLKGGVCLVQSAGECVRIPPFCPIMCLSLKTSILATYSIVTANQLANMLSKLPLLLAWFKTEIDGERKKREFATALLSHLSAILQGAFEESDLKKQRYPYSEEGPLHTLLHSWDDIKHALAGIVDAVGAEEVILMWDTFLRNAKGRPCWLCGKNINNELREMRNHFETMHWSTEKSAGDAEQEPQSHLQSQHGTERITTPSVSLEDNSEDVFHDAMEAAHSQDEMEPVLGGEGAAARPVPQQMEEPDFDDVMDTSEGL